MAVEVLMKMNDHNRYPHPTLAFVQLTFAASCCSAARVSPTFLLLRTIVHALVLLLLLLLILTSFTALM
jgi:hypothetical protein